MYGTTGLISSLLGAFHMAEVSMRYSNFMPRFYNLAKSLGFRQGKIMPSRAFCSDESQGYPIILIAKHFGTFPFNHGLVGGIVATDRHAPHAHHGKDLVIIQASHVGYDPKEEKFGVYRRLQTEDSCETSSCGKICGALEWYLNEFEFAHNNIQLFEDNGIKKVVIDNQLLHSERVEGLLLKLDRIVKLDSQGDPIPEMSRSTAKVFLPSDILLGYLKDYEWKTGRGEPIGYRLHPDLFYFKRKISHHHEGRDHLEKNLLEVMPYVVTSEWPALTAAQANTQVEFDRAFRTIVKEPSYRNKKILFVSGLNVDISPQEGQVFPLTKFIPWAAYVQDESGNHETWEQAELYKQLQAQSTENPDQVDLETAIEIMEKAAEIKLPF
ncbi:hypothetical protein [Solemya velesiana gill symbiont]|uniref:Limiting CO2-inducible protein B/C beta carbonyic anhydrase domain-containing protein n=1 Tax=Solemya velesiana gill symbiont TaxID=1918948 RepID=A0A1T2KSS5_9GAMM|nr:hypothetical protein [Solemya velesiana gill symbiont]OOZ35841.1 hypothetical protein BOW51_10060 [Solemya velesiana gill symbiont]